MERWIDVDPLDWFYRDTLEMTRLKTNLNGDEVLAGKTYNVFAAGHERIVRRFITTEGQLEFLLPGYTYDANDPVYVIVNGVEVLPEKVENGKVTMSNPLSAGIEVVCVAYGIPDIKRIGCVESPYEGCSDRVHPWADLKYKSTYFFSMNHKPETCTVLGKKLKRITVKINPGDNVEDKIEAVIGDRKDAFTIYKGRVYLPYMYKDFPAKIGYNAVINRTRKHTSETVVVQSRCVRYNDRFFPGVRLLRGEFFALMGRLLENIHNRFTDRTFQINPHPTRHVADRASWEKRWYGGLVLSMLNEKFADGCYVFPLYKDERFEAEECMTRAEAVTYLNRFIEWVTEVYR
ncbi:hypothetical protein [Paenibacillus massiliensis]|uniref:hypothetical protein n=1 Tax=Paenibacillus massiliensis TaxID=225917 RepID=UPI00036A7482|nr:hypothetical protein [Paenibacillus massiliensis]